MSFADKIPATAHDRLGFLVVERERLKLFAPHPLVGELERIFRCTGCGMDIAVGPCWEGIDPRAFVGVSCGCLTVETLPGSDGGVAEPGTAGNGRSGGSDG